MHRSVHLSFYFTCVCVCVCVWVCVFGHIPLRTHKTSAQRGDCISTIQPHVGPPIRLQSIKESLRQSIINYWNQQAGLLYHQNANYFGSDTHTHARTHAQRHARAWTYAHIHTHSVLHSFSIIFPLLWSINYRTARRSSWISRATEKGVVRGPL